MDSFNPLALKQVIVVLLSDRLNGSESFYIWTNGMAQRGAKSKHRPHSVVNQFKCFLYNHTANDSAKSRQIILFGGGGLVNLFHCPFPLRSLMTL